MTLTGEVLELVDPPSRSVWAEPNPEHDDLQDDDPGAVAEAAAEAITTDVDAWLAEQEPNPIPHYFSKWWSDAVQRALLDEGASLAQQRALDLHLNRIGPGISRGAPPHSHFQALWKVNKSTSCERITTTSASGKDTTREVWTGGVLSRSAMLAATSWLVEHGWLVKQDRGWFAPGQKRPALYTIAPKVFELSRKPGSDEAELIAEALQVLTDALPDDVAAKLAELVRVHEVDRSTDHPHESFAPVHEVDRSTRVHEVDRIESESDLPTMAKGQDRWVAPGARCDTCGGSVTTNPHTGQPNPRCRSCHRASQTERATAEVATLDHLGAMRALMGRGWGNRYADRRSGPDRDELVRLFGGDEVAVRAAESLRYSFGQVLDREAAAVWRAAYAEAGGRP
jgi:hypothetical protein